jgi:hypothetical protein
MLESNHAHWTETFKETEFFIFNFLVNSFTETQRDTENHQNLNH